MSKNFDKDKKMYNIWKTPKGNDTKYFGSFPKIY